MHSHNMHGFAVSTMPPFAQMDSFDSIGKPALRLP
jgi:hypothetical protein